MDLSVWITYLIATIILSVTPGPGVFSSISSGLHHGFRLGMWNAVGMQAAASSGWRSWRWAWARS
jgi:homoserine/homoserine lactone efflux protein